jgi:hypothetical protein
MAPQSAKRTADLRFRFYGVQPAKGAADLWFRFYGVQAGAARRPCQKLGCPPSVRRTCLTPSGRRRGHNIDTRVSQKPIAPPGFCLDGPGIFLTFDPIIK